MSLPRGATAIVTGAGSGIGRAVALALAAQGSSIWLAGRRLQALETVASQVALAGGTARCWQIDLTRDDEIDLLARTAGGESAGLDLLVHSAGEIRIGPMGTSAVDDFDAQYRINLRAPYLLTQRLLPQLRAARGQVVFVNSQAGLSAGANVAQYAATKFGLRALADSLRAEVNGDGVRVLSVYPGRTATPMQERLHEMEGRTEYHPQRLAQPDDVAGLVVHAPLLPRTSEVTDLTMRPMRKL